MRGLAKEEIKAKPASIQWPRLVAGLLAVFAALQWTASAQGAIKLAVVSGEAGLTLPLVWMAASAAVPFLVFLVPRQSANLNLYAQNRERSVG